MDDVVDVVVFFEWFLDFVVDFFYGFGIIVTYFWFYIGNCVVDVFLICRIEVDGVDFDEDVVVMKFGVRYFLDGGFVFFYEYDCFGWYSCGFEVWCCYDFVLGSKLGKYFGFDEG